MMLHPTVVEVLRAGAARRAKEAPVLTAKQIAFARARARGIELVVAAVVGPNCTVMPDPVQAPASWSRAA